MQLLWICRPAASIIAFRCSRSTSCRTPPAPSMACAGLRALAGLWRPRYGILQAAWFISGSSGIPPRRSTAKPTWREADISQAPGRPGQARRRFRGCGSAQRAAGLAHHSHGIRRVQRLLGADRQRPGARRRLRQAALTRPPCDARCGSAASLSRWWSRWSALHGRDRLGGTRPGAVIGFKEGGVAMKLSARNQIKGKILEVRKGATTAHVRIDIGNGVVITSSITNEAVDDLALSTGDDAIAVIKASDVMVAK